jgi:hypothetical protein
VVLGGEILEADVMAADGLDERGVAEGVLGVGPAAQGGVADDFAGPDDANVGGVKRVDEAQAALNPFAFPADLGDGIVGEIGGPAGARRSFPPATTKPVFKKLRRARSL